MRRFTIETRGDDYSRRLQQEISDRLCGLDFVCDPESPELIITIGGDGTFLRAIHRQFSRLNEVAFVGIHTGTLGFFTDY